MPAESVLVVPRSAVLPTGGWRGVRTTGVDETLAVIANKGEYRPRGEVEGDPALKQVIPYLVLRDGERWFLMRRTRGGGDTRLHDLWTIGIGGHLNPGDGDVHGGLHREWREELLASFEPTYRIVGILNDDTTAVGQVHIGVVCVADAGGRPVDIRETDKLTGAFASTAEVRAVVDDMETWSCLTFEALEGAAVE
jgi:predicted NUDIX family phosphoesterase